MEDTAILYNDEGERDSIINKLSDELLLQNLQEQLDVRVLSTFNPTNFLSVFNDRFTYLNMKYTDDAELRNVFRDIKFDLYTKICTGIESKFDLAANFNPNTAPSNYFFYVKKMYEFFILDYRRNLVNFFIQYIINNKAEIVKMFKPKTNKKDLGVISLRRALSKLDDVIVVYNLEEIIGSLVESMDDGDFIVGTVVSGDEDDAINSVIRDLFVDSTEGGFLGLHFASHFFAPMSDDQYSFDIISEIKSSFIKAAMKK